MYGNIHREIVVTIRSLKDTKILYNVEVIQKCTYTD